MFNKIIFFLFIFSVIANGTLYSIIQNNQNFINTNIDLPYSETDYIATTLEKDNIKYKSNLIALGIDKYLINHIKDEKERNEITDVVLRLIEEKKNHKHLVLYTLAIAKVESNFKMVHALNDKSSTIFGLCQVSWYWHKDKLMKEGITKDLFFNDKYSSFKSGLIIFENYLINNNFNYVKALEAYNPNANGFTSKYISSINREFSRLQLKIMYEILHNNET